MIYKGFTITIRPAPGGYWADYQRPNEEYNTRIPRENRFEAIQDAKREINRILFGEQELTAATAEYDHIKEQWADYPRPWEDNDNENRN